MFRRYLMVLAALLVLASESAASAQEIMLEGPLAGAPACRNCTLYRHGRFSIAPMFYFTLLDVYRRHIFVGARIQYNITDWLAVGVSGGAGGFWGSVLDTNLTEEVANEAPNGSDSNRANYPFAADQAGEDSAIANTTNLLGRIHGFVSFEMTFTPFRGKLGLFSRLFLDVDLYIFLGYPITIVQERGNVDCRRAEFIEDRLHNGGRLERDGQTYTQDEWNSNRESDWCPWVDDSHPIERANRIAISAGTYGLGVSIYANDWLAVVMEYRAMPILWNHTGTDERGMALVDDELTFCPSDAGEGVEDYCGETGEFPDHRVNENDRTWTINHMFSIGVVFHLPLTPRRSP